ncbi:putative ADP-ribosylation factor GTPase-activating protein AGD11 [Cinnamomum micranthum f. kanehirae]|uniref:Putative ADP-ribosylation factor GTPase-activating protein AGD11 n=1 Tax=Cinnamomum micranthum f. kanehirae TaxID=337451 RepID=A0A3S4NAH6_9MAGN|nr:putative ADP-ribosylation factor GTPase-activating protein AGD11 [Cinnamomum micranthum f. kanehirae]
MQVLSLFLAKPAIPMQVPSLSLAKPAIPMQVLSLFLAKPAIPMQVPLSLSGQTSNYNAGSLSLSGQTSNSNASSLPLSGQTSNSNAGSLPLCGQTSDSNAGSLSLSGQTSNSNAGTKKRLEDILSQPANRICADCGSPDPKWASLNLGVFICIKCSGVHRSLGVHISKILSVKLDDWTGEEVEALEELGGNTVVNMKYEAFVPECKKPKPDSSIEERSDFIRKKYELEQFTRSNEQNNASASSEDISAGNYGLCPIKKQDDKHHSGQHRRLGFGYAFRNSWRKPELKTPPRKNTSVNVVRGTNLAIRDVVSSDPYVILSMGHQSVKTRVIKSNLNPVWNERLMLSIPDPVPPLKLLVYDKDKFSADDRMGEAEIDIQPLVSAAKAYENSTISESMQLGKWLASEDNTLVKDSVISLIDGKVKQEITLRLQNVERGELEIELECVPLNKDEDMEHLSPCVSVQTKQGLQTLLDMNEPQVSPSFKTKQGIRTLLDMDEPQACNGCSSFNIGGKY